MGLRGWIELAVLFGAVVAAGPSFGSYMYRVFEGTERPLPRSFGRVERALLQLCGIDGEEEQTWPAYLGSLLLFHLLGFAVLYAILRLQHRLPLNPAQLGPMAGALAFNTAASFVSNTDWQAYTGERALSYLSQMLGLAWQNFTSAAAGIGVGLALARGLTRKPQGVLRPTVGSFPVDLIRSLVYVLLPTSLAAAVFFVSQGVIQSLAPYVHATTVEGASQLLPMGPVASQESIKLLGSNGGGFFGANSAHPFENPTPLTNLVEMFLVLWIPSGLIHTYGEMAGNKLQSWAILLAIALFFLGGSAIGYLAESSPNSALAGLPLDHAMGNMEGKELRLGAAASASFAAVTTASSCGATNAMLDSFNPLGGLVPMVLMQLGEVVFGGVGGGLAGLLIFALLSVFLAGLMVGRTPELLGKKIEAREMKLVVLYLLVYPLFVLVFTAWSGQDASALSSEANAGPHGLTERLYAYSSAVANNGSAFAGLNADTAWWNVTTGVGMLAGRFLPFAPVLAIAGSLAGKKRVPPGPGTFPTDSVLFAFLLTAVIAIVGALTFFPVISLGPLVEHFAATAGRLF
ncbi:potassium-transporting ATPase subunit KdpA [Vulgatibacter incomptus]|uniref:Potassium-transporting ATPase potassium-binding subunit n=1 Tax=Vulgatibacter incomptus TaxID=1391653 RepID=A0A0K1P8B0_9BACT|nr:potassium-transporting ATPase subunit KdpA [Vulgatibacter incomptus]AKU89750.1 Potassium-transporting ATPase A chain [Vulgatibacter incomptus]